MNAGAMNLPNLFHPLLERQNLQNRSVQMPRSTSRCLFGPCDPAITENLLERIIEEDAKRMMLVWEFDPRTEKGVENPKRFVWEKIHAEGDPAEREGAIVKSPMRAVSLPAVAACLAGKENCGVGSRLGERKDNSPAVAASTTGRNLGIGEEVVRGGEPSSSPADAAAVAANEDSDRSRLSRRFKPYTQRRITDYMRKTKAVRESKGNTPLCSKGVNGVVGQGAGNGH